MRNLFKRILSVTLAARLAVSLAACGNNGDNGGGHDSSRESGPYASTGTAVIGLCNTANL